MNHNPLTPTRTSTYTLIIIALIIALVMIALSATATPAAARELEDAGQANHSRMFLTLIITTPGYIDTITPDTTPSTIPHDTIPDYTPDTTPETESTCGHYSAAGPHPCPANGNPDAPAADIANPTPAAYRSGQ